MKLAVIIVHYCNESALERTLKALRAQLQPIDRLLIVDNASPGTDLHGLAERFGALLVVRSCNDGYAAAVNEGRSRCLDCDFVLVLTHECVLAENALPVLLERMMERPRLGAAGPLLGRLSSPSHVWSAGGTFAHRSGRPIHLTGPTEVGVWRDSEPREVDWLDGAALLVRTQAAQDVGRFDEDYFLYVEEVDFLRRMRESGWAVEIVPKAVAWQESSSMPPYLEARNVTRYLRVHGQRRQLIVFACSQAVTVARVAIRGRVREAYARLVGVRHGFSGHMDRSLASRR